MAVPEIAAGAVMEWPRITVVTPVLNGASTLASTMSSVLGQGYPNLEYIVVDGGSTDGSIELVKRQGALVARLLQGVDRNLYDAVAKGFDAATGDVLAWLNSDDEYEPGALERVAAAFRADRSRQVVYFNGTVLKDGWRLQNRPQRAVGYDELMAGHVLYQDSVFFRREAYEAVGGLDREHFRLAGDYDLWLRLAARFAFHFEEDCASCFRLREGQLSGDQRGYLREMEVARLLALKRGGRGVAAVRRRLDNAGLDFPLRGEDRAWPVLRAAPREGACRCPVCGNTPGRLLLTVAERDGRTPRTYYHCRECDAAFVYPRLEPVGSDPPRDGFRVLAAEPVLAKRPEYAWLGTMAGESDFSGVGLDEAGDPVEWARRSEGRCVTVPNLDSAWIARFGAAWCGWHLERGATIWSETGLRRLAERAGLKAKILRSVTPPGWLAQSEWQAEWGAWPRGGVPDAHVSRLARGASVVSRWTGDRRGRGDCLVVEFSR